MSSTRWLGVLLATLLMGFCLFGNSLGGDRHLVSIFPWAVSLLAFPLVIYPGLHMRARNGPATAAQLRRAGWSIVWPAAIVFACFTTALSVATFAHPATILLAVVFAGTLVATAILGLLCVQLCALIIAGASSTSRAA